MAFVLPFLSPAESTLAVVLLTVSAVILDFGVTANLTLSQRALFALGAEHRSRLNSVFMTAFYIGRAAGSALRATLYTVGGFLHAVIPALAALAGSGVYYLTEFGKSRNAQTMS